MLAGALLRLPRRDLLATRPLARGGECAGALHVEAQRVHRPSPGLQARVGREAKAPKRAAGKHRQRPDLEGLEHRIGAYPVALPDPAGKVHRLAVDQDEVDLVQGEPQRLEPLAEGSAGTKRAAEGHLPPVRREEVA